MQLKPALLSLKFCAFWVCLLCPLTLLPSPHDAFADETFRVRISSAPKSLDWTVATSGSEGAIIQNIMRGALSLSKHIAWNENSKILTLSLRTDIRWSDGRPLKCQHFLDGFERLLSPNLNSPNASLVFAINQAREYFLGKQKDFAPVGVKCPKPEQLELQLNESRYPFENVLSHWSTFPLRKDNLKLTLGAYRIVNEQQLKLKIQPGFSGPKDVQFVVVPDGSRALLDSEAGKLQYLFQVEDDLLNPGVLKIPGVDFVDDLKVVALLHLNPSRIHTDSPEKRRAIMARIPLKDFITSPSRIPAPTLIPVAKTGFFQPQGAQSKVLPSEILTLGYPNDGLSKNIAQTLQEKITGIKITSEAMGPNPKNEAKRYDLVLSLFGLDYGDPRQLLGAFASQGTLDYFDFSSNEAITPDLLQNRAAIVMPLFYRRRAYWLDPKYQFERGAKGTANLTRIVSSVRKKKNPEKK